MALRMAGISMMPEPNQIDDRYSGTRMREEALRFEDSIAPRLARGTEPTPTPYVRQSRTARAIVEDVWAHKDDPPFDLTLARTTILKTRGGNIVLLIGGTGRGKSTMAIQFLIEHAQTEDGISLAQTLELPDEEWTGRAVGSRCQASWLDALTGKVPKEHMISALPERLFVLDRSKPSLATLDKEIESLRVESPEARILVAVDYVQLVMLGDPNKDIRVRIGDVMREVDAIARRYRVVMLVLSQGSRASSRSLSSGEKVGNDTTDTGAESADLERWASVTLAIGTLSDRDEHGSQRGVLSVGKMRHGIGDIVFNADVDLRVGLWTPIDDGAPASSLRTEKKQKNVEQLKELVHAVLTASAEPLFVKELVKKAGKRKVDVTEALRLLCAEHRASEAPECAKNGNSPYRAIKELQ